MKHKFTKREKVLLIIMVVLLLFTCYYWGVIQPVNNQISTAKTQQSEAQEELTIEKVKSEKLVSMQSVLKKQKDSGEIKSEIPVYDNVEQVMVQLGTILGSAQNYTLTFNDLTYGENLISRPIKMTFTCARYTSAENILRQLDQCIYRCSLSDMTMTGATQDTDVTGGSLNVTVTVTFYEAYAEGDDYKNHIASDKNTEAENSNNS